MRATCVDFQESGLIAFFWDRLVKFCLLFGALVVPAASGQTPAAAKADGKPPNIVFLLTDDMGYSDPGCYGGKFVPTPNIDRLATEGMRYTHFYVNALLCSPSRAAFLTGMFPARWNFTNFL